MADARDRGSFEVVLGVFVVLAFSLLIRVWWVIGRRKRHVRKREKPVKTVVVIGSGGHTTEMLRLMSGLSAMYCPRTYIAAETDKMSQEKIEQFEIKRKLQLLTDQESKDEKEDYEIIRIPRSREVRQSYLTSLCTTLHAIKASFPLVYNHKPDLILCNGPGTCIPVCLAAIMLKIFCLLDVTIVYVESICRVDTLSLSGRMLYHVADHFFVQWQQLQDKYPKAVFLGRLV